MLWRSGCCRTIQRSHWSSCRHSNWVLVLWVSAAGTLLQVQDLALLNCPTVCLWMYPELPWVNRLADPTREVEGRGQRKMPATCPSWILCRGVPCSSLHWTSSKELDAVLLILFGHVWEWCTWLQVKVNRGWAHGKGDFKRSFSSACLTTLTTYSSPF